MIGKDVDLKIHPPVTEGDDDLGEAVGIEIMRAGLNETAFGYFAAAGNRPVAVDTRAIELDRQIARYAQRLEHHPVVHSGLRGSFDDQGVWFDGCVELKVEHGFCKDVFRMIPGNDSLKAGQ